MDTIKKVAGCLFLLCVASNFTHAKEWRGITPLRSTREDVIRLLGYSDAPCGCRYDLGDETVSLNYSKGPCEKGMPDGWNVARDTVLGIHVNLIARPLLADLHLDEKRFERVEDRLVLGNVYYTDKEEGITYGTYEGRVNWISYHPAARDEHLRCPDIAPVAPREKGPVTLPLGKLDIYGDVPFEQERPRLDNLASALRDKPDARGYIIVYAGRRACVGEAEVRAKRAKDYVVGARGIEADRVVAADGGHREGLEVEIWTGSPGAGAPTPHPTVNPSQVQIIKDCKKENNNRPSRRSSRGQRRSLFRDRYHLQRQNKRGDCTGQIKVSMHKVAEITTV